MRIQLRQTEIEEALQQYIANQGINLAGKVVDKAGKEVVQAGFGHGGDCISGMS